MHSGLKSEKFNLEKPLCLLQFFWAALFEQNLKKNTLCLSLDVIGQLLLVHTFHCCSCTIFSIFSSLWSCVISQLLHSTFFNQKVKDYTRQRRLSSLSTSGNSWLVVAFIGRKGWPWDFYSEKMSDYQTITLTSSYMYKVRTQRRPSITANTYVKNLKIK